jgi:aminoglycoside phosphotransferase (APT) family kinase protein
VPGVDIEVDIQYRCMAAVAQGGKVPIAPLVGYEADPAVLGAPFFVMGFVGGEVPIESPPYTESGFFVDASPADRRRLIENGLTALAALHRMDWRTVGLEWLVPPGVTPGSAQQLHVWETYARRELDGRAHPLLEDALAWLHANLPTDETVGFCWGDPRPGNIIWQDFTPVCLTDFEAASIASPLQDLGWWLMFDRTMHPDGTRLDGDPTRDEQREIYARAAGIDVPDTRFSEVFAGARYAAIVVRVMNRMVARGHLPADNTIWIENPATAALRELMEEQK